METIKISTKKSKEIVDITDKVQAQITKCKLKNGWCRLFLAHTTAGLTTSFIDPVLDMDIIDAYEVEIPMIKQLQDKYQHHHHIAHLPSHVTAAHFGPSISIPVKNGKMMLGKFQRVVVVELNGPRKRQVIFDVNS